MRGPAGRRDNSSMPTRRLRRRVRRELPPRAKLLFGISTPEYLIGAHGGFHDEEEAREGWEHHREAIIRHENRNRGPGELFVPPPFWYYDAPHIDAQRFRVPDKFYRGGYRKAESDAALAARFGLHTPADLIRYRRPKTVAPPPRKAKAAAVLEFPVG